MKNNLDKNIDSKIKESFDGVQNKAPMDLWDSISEEMDLDQNLDGKLDSKLKDSFDGQLDKTVAPAFLWGSITDGLVDGAEFLDSALDRKVKESYEIEVGAKTPNSVWFAINRQLNIDKTWNKISKALDVKPVVSDWRKRMISFMAAASILLLFVKTCDFAPQPLNTNYTSQTIEQELSTNKKQQKNNVSPLLNFNKGNKNKVTTVENENNVVNNNNVTGQATDLIVTAANKTTPLSANLSVTTQDKNEQNNSSSTLRKGKKIDKVGNKIDFVGAGLDVKGNSTSENSNGSESSSTAEKDNTVNQVSANNNNSIDKKTTDKVLIASGVDQQLRNNPLKSGQIEEPINWALLDAIKGNKIPFDYTVEPIQLLGELALEKKKKKNLIEGKLEAGAFMAINSTMLLNNQTREGFDKNSLVQNYFGLAANYGLWASYRITPKGSLVAEFSINADNKQAYGVYSKGVYYIEEWLMKYNRISIAYKHDLWSTSSDQLVNTRVVAQGGFYFGFLREAKLFYDGNLVYDFVDDHHKFDFGFKVTLGQEIVIDKFVIGYGLRSDIGIVNIFKGNSQVAGQENQTRMIQLGGYVSLGYRF
jgi:hypothetical protein